MSFRLTAYVEAIAGRQRRRFVDDLLHVLLTSPDGPPSAFAKSATRRCRFLPLDDLRRSRFDELGDLPQRDHPRLARRDLLGRREVQIARVGRQRADWPSATAHSLHSSVRRARASSSTGVAGKERPDRLSDLLDRDSDVGGGVVVEPDGSAAPRLLGRLEVGGCPGLRDPSARTRDEIVSCAGSGTVQVDPYRPGEAEGSLDAGIGFIVLADRRLYLLCVRLRSARSM
jgi:hypothetical protein